MQTVMLSELVADLTEQLENSGDRPIYYRPEPEPGVYGDVVPLENHIHRLNDDPELGNCYTLS